MNCLNTPPNMSSPPPHPIQAHVLPPLRSLQGQRLTRGCPTSRISLVLHTKPCFLQPLVGCPAQPAGCQGTAQFPQASPGWCHQVSAPVVLLVQGWPALQDGIRLSSPCGRQSKLALDVPARTFSSRKWMYWHLGFFFIYAHTYIYI